MAETPALPSARADAGKPIDAGKSGISSIPGSGGAPAAPIDAAEADVVPPAADALVPPATDVLVPPATDVLVPPTPIDTAPVVDASPPPNPAARCPAALPAPGEPRRVSGGRRSDDLAFDSEGHFVSFDFRSVVRMQRDGSVDVLVRDLIGTRGGALRGLPSGDLVIADFENRALFVRSPAGQVRRLPEPIDQPMKMVRGPAGGLYVTSKSGEISRVDEVSGAIRQVGRLPVEVGGLTFNHDYSILYVGAIGNDTLHAFDVRADGGLGPSRLQRSQVRRPQALASDACGNVYVVSEGDARIRRIEPAGGNTVVADLGPGVYPWSLGFGSGKQGWVQSALYVSQPAGQVHEIPLGVPGQGPPPARVD